jgi:hypothetical protein
MTVYRPVKPQSGKLLLDEAPLVILPSLARAIGLEAAVVLQQLHFLIRLKIERHREHPEERARDIHDGHVWVWNTYDKWQENYFPFLSVRSLQRIFLNLENTGLILVGNYNDSNLNKTKWYSINYDHLLLKTSTPTATSESGQSERHPTECGDQRKSVVDGARMAQSTCQVGAMEDANLASCNNTKTTLTKTTTTMNELSLFTPEKNGQKEVSAETFRVPATREEADKIIQDVIKIIYPRGEGIKNRSKLIHGMMEKLKNGDLKVPEGWKEAHIKKKYIDEKTDEEQRNKDETDAQEARAKFNAMPDNEKKKYLDAARKKYGHIASDVYLQFVAVKLAMDEKSDGSLLSYDTCQVSHYFGE